MLNHAESVRLRKLAAIINAKFPGATFDEIVAESMKRGETKANARYIAIVLTCG